MTCFSFRTLCLLVGLSLVANVAWADSTSKERKRTRLQEEITALTQQIGELRKQGLDLRVKYEEAKKVADEAATVAEAARQATLDVREAMVEARKQADSTKTALETLTTQFTEAWQGEQETKQLMREFDQARRAMDAARMKALMPLQTTSDYERALKARDAAQKGLARAKMMGSTGYEMAGAAAKVVEHDSIVTRMEQDVLSQDADYVAAKKAYDDISLAWAAAQEAFKQSLLSHPEYKPTLDAMLAAETALEPATDKVTKAYKTQSDTASDAVRARARENQILAVGQNLDRQVERRQAEIAAKQQERRNLN